MTVESNYKSINEKLNELRCLLIRKLKIFKIEVEREAPFIELIEAIGDIKSVKTVTENNYKPTHMPEIDENANLSTFNIMLHSRIKYYMKLLRYFLVLKGVPIYEIDIQTDLKGLIELVGTIDAVKPSTLSLENVERTQYFGVGIKVPYTLVDSSEKPIKEGNITIEDNLGIVYDSVRAGEAIVIAPLGISKENEETTFTITYDGTDKYMQSNSCDFTVKILPSQINLILTITNMSMSSRYYNSQTTGYKDDEWTISIHTLNHQNKPLSDIPFELSIDDDVILNANTDDDGFYVLNHQVIDKAGEHEITCKTTYSDTDINTDTDTDTDKLLNTSIKYTIHIKYNILKQAEDNYIDYTGKDNYQYQIEVIDEDNGQKINQYDGQSIKVSLYERDNEGVYNEKQIYTTSINDGEAKCTIDSLTPGDKLLEWVFEYDNFSARITTTLNILSNFILPEKQNYFLNDTPIIIYRPDGAIESGKTVIGTLEYVNNEDAERTIVGYETEPGPSVFEGYEQKYNEETGEWENVLDTKGNPIPIYSQEEIQVLNEEGNPIPIYDDYIEPTIVTEDITLTTNKEGKLNTISNYKNVGFYTLTLYSGDNLDEVCTWQYELKKPFDVEVVSYDKKQSIKYKVTIYDTSDNTNFIINNSVPNQISINNIITIQGVQISQLTNYSDDNSELHEYTYPTCILTIYKTNDFVKNNEIIFKHNAYQESFNFRFVNEIFTLSEETETVTLGEDTMKIKCNDSSVTSIDIESPDFEINNIVYDNNIFIIDAVFLKAGRISFIVTDDSLYSESLSIEVNKVNLMPYIDALIYVTNPQSSNTRDNNVGYEDRNRISVSFVIDNELYSDLPITYTVKQGNNQLYTQSFTYKADAAENDFTLTVPENLTPNQYQIEFDFIGDSNYCPFTKTIDFEVLKIYPNYEITNKYTNFKHNFFIYKPDFTAENPESIKVNANSKTYSTQSDGIWKSAGYYLEKGWANTGLWECDFDMSTEGGVRYIGISILQQPYSGGYLIGGWEGPLATNPPGNYTRDNNNTLSILNGSIWSNNNVPWCHINIKKTSPTTLTITKTGDNVNNGSVTYEWQELSNYPTLTFGTWAHNVQNIAYLKVKNFIVRGVYYVD